MIDEDVLVGFLVFDLGEVLRDHAKAPGVDADHIDGRLALDDPFGDLPAGAAGRGNTKAVALGNPEIRQPEGRTNHRISIRRVRDRAVDDVLDARVLEGRHPVDRRLDMRHQALQVSREKILLEARGHAIGETGRRALLIGAEDPAHALLAEVVRGIGLAQHRQFRVAGLAILLQHGVDIGDDILVFDRNRGDLQADHLGRRARVVAGAADHMFAGDVALGCLDHPLAIAVALDAGHLGLLIDFRAPGSRALGECHGDVNRRDMTVGWVPQRPDQAVHVADRPELLDLVDADQVAFDTDRLGGALIVSILIHAFAVAGEAKVAVDVQPHRLTGLGLQGLVELDGILMQLADRVAHIEER